MKQSFILVIVLLALVGCINIPPTQEIQEVNKLNDLAYEKRYRSLHLTEESAKLAYDLANNYKEGRAEACNHLGFYYFMKMDFVTSSHYVNEVYSITRNQLDLLIADIGMMKIAQRTAQNKLFYDYRNSALHRMKEIKEDQSVFDTVRDKRKLNYAFSEFYIVSIIYYYYLQQLDTAKEMVQKLNEYQKNSFLYDINQTDLSQLLYYKYVEATTNLINGANPKERLLNTYDQLLGVYKLASEYGLIYFKGNTLQGIANLMIKPEDYDILKSERYHTFSTFKLPITDDFPITLANEAMLLFRKYGDLYQISGAYVSMARIANYRKEFSKAIAYLDNALDCVNIQHNLYYATHHEGKVDELKLYDAIGNESLELLWIADGVLTVPYWIGRIREQLSVGYAGLNNKEASDYNRNVYLDILELVRQDKEAESRYEILRAEEKWINGLLLTLFISLIVIIGGFYLLNKRIRRKTSLYLGCLKRSLRIGQEITASLPLEAITTEDVLQPIVSILHPFLKDEFAVDAISLNIEMLREDEEKEEAHFDTLNDNTFNEVYHFNLLTDEVIVNRGVLLVYTTIKLNKETLSLINLLIPSITWAIENGLYFINLGGEIDMLDKKLYVTEQHNTNNRRENIFKRACMRVVYGIQPYIDRVRDEINKIAQSDYAQKEEVRAYKLNYIQELIGTIDEYNAVLSLWIKIKQGYLSLQITNFELNSLFELIEKGRRLFEQKEIKLIVKSTEVCVKADRALTLFMINTLIENARKYTAKGGEVELRAEEHTDYVEVIIEDSGVGLSAEEIKLILNEKVYDSALIGRDNQLVAKSKGVGFGLMNCKAIIDKYKKTNPLFKVCSFNIESKQGKGSRFSFRLPIGLRKIGTVIVAFISLLSFASCNNYYTENFDPVEAFDFLTTITDTVAMTRASNLADSAYFANTRREYDVALNYIDSAFIVLNNYYIRNRGVDRPLLQLDGTTGAAEEVWFKREVDVNYYIILDLRNEAAVASLALHQLNQYDYNNEAYTTLYKFLTKDYDLDNDCRLIQQSTSNKQVALSILIMMILSTLFVYYFVFIKRRYMRRWSLEQVSEIYGTIFSSSLLHIHKDRDGQLESNLSDIPARILKKSFTQLNNLISVDWVAIVVHLEERDETYKVVYPDETTIIDMEQVKLAYIENRTIMDGQYHYLPLVVNLKQYDQKLGVFILKRRIDNINKEDDLYIQLIVKYLSTVLYNTLIRTAGRFQEIELVKNEIGRLEWENNFIHIQNKILDNCLSAIKHETIYYPSRIKQLVNDTVTDKKRLDIASLKDLVEYYYGVFTTLSQWAQTELERATFRRSSFKLSSILLFAEQYFYKRLKKIRIEGLSLIVEHYDEQLSVLGDGKLLQYLFELLITDAMALDSTGKLKIEATADDSFIHFSFSDDRCSFTKEELEELFYPNLKWIEAAEQKGVSGQTFLIAKEIIREHDEFVGRRGCKIRAIPLEKGYRLTFSIVKK